MGATALWFGFVLFYLVGFADWAEFKKPNQFGDFFAGVFAPVAFFWLIVTVFMQSRELKLQREELKQAVTAYREQNLIHRESLDQSRKSEIDARTHFELDSIAQYIVAHYSDAKINCLGETFELWPGDVRVVPESELLVFGAFQSKRVTLGTLENQFRQISNSVLLFLDASKSGRLFCKDKEKCLLVVRHVQSRCASQIFHDVGRDSTTGILMQNIEFEALRANLDSALRVIENLPTEPDVRWISETNGTGMGRTSG